LSNENTKLYTNEKYSYLTNNNVPRLGAILLQNVGGTVRCETNIVIGSMQK